MRNEKGQFTKRYNFDESAFIEPFIHKFWLLGLFAADGNVRRGKSGVFSIAQSGDGGLEVIRSIKSVIHSDHRIYERELKEENHSTVYAINLVSRSVIAEFKNWGLVPSKTKKLSFPEIGEESFLKSYIRGYFDGDGSIGKYDVGGSTGYPKMSIFANTDFINTLNKKIPINGATSKQKEEKQIHWNGQKARKFGRWLFENSNLPSTPKSKFFWNNVDNWKCRYDRYAEEKEKAKQFLEEGKSVMDFADKLSVNFQTIYRWKKQWEL